MADINPDHFLADQIAPSSRTEAHPLLSPDPRPIRGGQNARELCQLVSDYDPDAWPDLAMVDPKLDGIRCLAVRPDQIVSREGQPLLAASHCVGALHALERAFGMPMFFDGELVHHGGFQKLQAAARAGRPSADITLWLFDAVPLAEWEKGDRWSGPRQDLGTRRRLLRNAIYRAQHANVGVVSGWIASREQAEKLAADMWARQLEGLVAKDAASFYVRDRARTWMRMKRCETSDVRVVSFSIAQSGAIPAATVECVTASGEAFKLSLRGPAVAVVSSEVISDRPEVWIEVKHSGLTDRGVPRHAQFVRVRDDKGGRAA